MAALLYYPSLLFAAWFLYLVYKYITNVIALRKLGFPIIHIPLVQQNHVLWMVSGPLSRQWLKRRLPGFIFNRLALSIYGHEFFQQHITYKELVEPRVRENPKLLGNGKTCALATSGRLEIWTYDIEFTKEIFTRSKDFKQFDIGSIVMGVFGQNVLTTDGTEWSRHRRIVAGAVTERVSSVVWNESVRQTRDLLSMITRSEVSTSGTKASSGTTYQMFDHIKRAAIHVLYAAGMGKTQDFTPDSTESPEKLPPGVQLPYFEAVRIINENTAGPTIFPTPLLRNWPSFLPGAAWLRSIGQAKIDFPKHTRANIDNEREMSASSTETRNNVMSALVNASERNEGDPEKGSSHKGPALSDEELVGNLYVFTAAGFDTTANTLSFALVLLTRHPRWQTWLIEELDSILPSPSPTSTSQPSYDYQATFSRSQRAQAIMFETLRLYTPIVHLMKMVTAPQSVHFASTNTTIVIPANTTVSVNFTALHTDPSIWRNLNMTTLERRAANDTEDDTLQDEHAFRPSRWLNPDGSFFKPQTGTYLPWSAGPRVCPGMKMAQVEFVGILTTLFSRHRLEAVRGSVQHKGAGPTGETVSVPESDDALAKRLDGVMLGSQPKLTLEMDLFNVDVDGPGGRGLGLRWIGR